MDKGITCESTPTVESFFRIDPGPTVCSSTGIYTQNPIMVWVFM